MRGATITIKCDCGQVQYVPYGESWTCPACGRRWNTNQIPAEEYWGIMREMRGYRLRVIGVALILAGVFAVLFITTGPGAISLVPLVMGGWFFFYMPRWRRKVRAATRRLPKWQLHPE
ncbi:MAG: hypothetical protein HY240_00610 [Actinobacteria bacterium]|nr:hypothetical protein [Actinomycetota bacterium]